MKLATFLFSTPASSPWSRKSARKAASSGFSLIEILIATSILLVIVMMVSMVFQQQSAAFQSGEDRVKGQAAIRNIVGMIVRDLALAVDSGTVPNAPDSNNFGTKTIKFLAMTGEAGVNAEGKEDKDCSVLQRITYTFSGNKVKREVTGYRLGSDGRWSSDRTVSANLNNDETKLKDVSFIKSPSNVSFPSNITIRAVYAGTSHAGSVRGECAGPDGDFDKKKDNIYVGGKP